MTNEQLAALARRAVACKGWRWMPGMLAIEWVAPGMSLTGGRPFRVDDGWHDVGVWIPDLTDPATLGCVLALVREAWGQKAVTSFWGYYWEVDYAHTIIDECMDHKQLGVGGTEAEALVAALEAAP